MPVSIKKKTSLYIKINFKTIIQHFDSTKVSYSLDPDQANVRPDQGPNYLKRFLEADTRLVGKQLKALFIGEHK